MIYLGQTTNITSDRIKIKQNINGNFEIIESTQSNNKSSRESIPSKYSHYTGIIFGINHFAVLDFLQKHRIVIVVDGFENNWQEKNSGIIKDNFDTIDQKKIIEAYKPRDGIKNCQKGRKQTLRNGGKKKMMLMNNCG